MTEQAPKKRGGRKAGTVNKVTAETRTRIVHEGRSIEFLLDVQNGEVTFPRVVKQRDQSGNIIDVQIEVPADLDQRIAAAKILVDKTVPNAKSRELDIELPPITTPADAVSAFAIIDKALSEKRIRLDEAQILDARVVSRLEALRQSKALEDMEAAINALIASGQLRRNAAGKLEPPSHVSAVLQ
jgi:hypothetical protein